MKRTELRVYFALISLCIVNLGFPKDRLVFDPPAGGGSAKHIVLISGDEEYRSEESMPMLGKLLSQKHGFKCTVLFALDREGEGYIDPNNQQGLRGLESLADADLMIIGTRFREPDARGARHIAEYLNAGKPIIGIRTSTHGFRGDGSFGGIAFDDFGLKILGETWVSHHGRHKVQGGRGVVEPGQADHPILKGVEDVFCMSDIYGVIHLTDADQILMRGAVTESLRPDSPNVEGDKNDPMQPFVWLHKYRKPNGSGHGQALCTTGGASVDFLNEGMRRIVVNGAYYLTGREVADKADVDSVDPFHPSFYGFIREPGYWKDLNLRPEDFDLGKSPRSPDPKGSPEWDFPTIAEQSPDENQQSALELRDGERVAPGAAIGISF